MEWLVSQLFSVNFIYNFFVFCILLYLSLIFVDLIVEIEIVGVKGGVESDFKILYRNYLLSVG